MLLHLNKTEVANLVGELSFLKNAIGSRYRQLKFLICITKMLLEGVHELKNFKNCLLNYVKSHQY